MWYPRLLLSPPKKSSEENIMHLYVVFHIGSDRELMICISFHFPLTPFTVSSSPSAFQPLQSLHLCECISWAQQRSFSGSGGREHQCGGEWSTCRQPAESLSQRGLDQAWRYLFERESIFYFFLLHFKPRKLILISQSIKLWIGLTCMWHLCCGSFY